MTVARGKGAKAKADKLFSKIVRMKGACEACGASDYSKLQCAHIFSRTYSATRCELANAFCLCAGCHRRFTARPLEFAEFCLEKRGAAQMRALNELAQPAAKVDWQEVAASLEKTWKALNA